MADLTIEELQAFNDTQREIIEKQQAEIEQLRHEVKLREQICADATLYARRLQEADGEIAQLRERLCGCIVKMRVAALISDWETFNAVYREALEE